MDTKERVTPVCQTCGSDDVLLDAYVSWDYENQAWEIASEPCDKNAYCHTCDGQVSVTWQ